MRKPAAGGERTDYEKRRKDGHPGQTERRQVEPTQRMMLEEDKVIVTEIAGTTHDLVEGEIHLLNVTLHLIDTASIHQTEGRVEQIGIRQSMKAMERS